MKARSRGVGAFSHRRRVISAAFLDLRRQWSDEDEAFILICADAGDRREAEFRACTERVITRQSPLRRKPPLLKQCNMPSTLRKTIWRRGL